MDKKQKFENFLKSLEDCCNGDLLESIKKGFQACYEQEGDTALKIEDVDGKIKIMSRDKAEEYAYDQGSRLVMCNNVGRGECNKAMIIYGKPSQSHWGRQDIHGIFTGIYCDECYKKNYPYKKGEYFDPAYAGERLEPDY